MGLEIFSEKMKPFFFLLTAVAAESPSLVSGVAMTSCSATEGPCLKASKQPGAMVCAELTADAIELVGMGAWFEPGFHCIEANLYKHFARTTNNPLKIKGDATHACADYYLSLPNLDEIVIMDPGRIISTDCEK